MLSVSMVTYNHEKYISQAIEGVLMQKTTFNIQLVIGEDCSTDNTRSICLQYKEKYPELIKLVLHDKNVGSKQNAIDTLQACDGKYIALCDGDDYWIDKNKLQMQVDFLESNPDFTLSCHRAKYLNENKKTLTVPKPLKRREFTQADVANHNFIQTLTVVYKADSIDKFPESFYTSKSSDYFINMLASKNGKINYMPDAMAVYRQHGGGIWTSLNQEKGILNTLAVLESFLADDTLGNDIKQNLKNNIVRHHIQLYDILCKSGKKEEAEKSLIQVLSSDFSQSWSIELQSFINVKKAKEYKIGRILLKPYTAFRKFLSKVTYFFHRINHE